MTTWLCSASLCSCYTMLVNKHSDIATSLGGDRTMKDSNTMLKKVIMNDNRNLNFLIDLNITFKLALLCSFLLYSKYHVLIHAMCSLSLQAYQLLWRCLFQYHQSPPELDKPVLPGETAHYCLSICLFYVVMVLPVTHVPLSIRPHPPAAGLAPVASTIY